MADINEIRSVLSAATDTISNAESHLIAAAAAIDDILRYLAHIGADALLPTAVAIESGRQDIWAIISHLRDATGTIGDYSAGL